MLPRAIEDRLHWIILAAALLFSIGGIVFSAWQHRSCDGGRGGAITVAISLMALFANRPYGARAFAFLTDERRSFLERLRKLRGSQQPSPVDRVADVERLLDAILVRINSEAEGQVKQNKFMAVSAGIGTFVWGFGDWTAAALQRFF